MEPLLWLPCNMWVSFVWQMHCTCNGRGPCVHQFSKTGCMHKLHPPNCVNFLISSWRNKNLYPVDTLLLQISSKTISHSKWVEWWSSTLNDCHLVLSKDKCTDTQVMLPAHKKCNAFCQPMKKHYVVPSHKKCTLPTREKFTLPSHKNCTLPTHEIWTLLTLTCENFTASAWKKAHEIKSCMFSSRTLLKS